MHFIWLSWRNNSFQQLQNFRREGLSIGGHVLDKADRRNDRISRNQHEMGLVSHCHQSWNFASVVQSCIPKLLVLSFLGLLRVLSNGKVQLLSNERAMHQKFVHSGWQEVPTILWEYDTVGVSAVFTEGWNIQLIPRAGSKNIFQPTKKELIIIINIFKYFLFMYCFIIL